MKVSFLLLIWKENNHGDHLKINSNFDNGIGRRVSHGRNTVNNNNECHLDENLVENCIQIDHEYFNKRNSLQYDYNALAFKSSNGFTGDSYIDTGYNHPEHVMSYNQTHRMGNDLNMDSEKKAERTKNT